MKKLEQKKLRWHTGYIGGLKEVGYDTLMKENSKVKVRLQSDVVNFLITNENINNRIRSSFASNILWWRNNETLQSTGSVIVAWDSNVNSSDYSIVWGWEGNKIWNWIKSSTKWSIKVNKNNNIKNKMEQILFHFLFSYLFIQFLPLYQSFGMVDVV